MESLSRVIYPALSLEVSDKMAQLFNKTNFDFIWKNKCHYIRKVDVIKSVEEGGLNAIDFLVMNGALKLKWLNSFFSHKSSFWFTIPDAIFKNLGGNELLLRCDCDLCKLPTKLSDSTSKFSSIGIWFINTTLLLTIHPCGTTGTSYPIGSHCF